MTSQVLSAAVLSGVALAAAAAAGHAALEQADRAAAGARIEVASAHLRAAQEPGTAFLSLAVANSGGSPIVAAEASFVDDGGGPVTCRYAPGGAGCAAAASAPAPCGEGAGGALAPGGVWEVDAPVRASVTRHSEYALAVRAVAEDCSEASAAAGVAAR